jgi:hypothetical protein
VEKEPSFNTPVSNTNLKSSPRNIKRVPYVEKGVEEKKDIAKNDIDNHTELIERLIMN